ncbi:hypothetical protein L288_20230 [Sphingobium quisquiliarum P25]|uniref:ABC transporter domain-containing protein n=1 Tax=Sphingobium quisquiliarum P25 TaxID=1329909 RepID=T0HM80_9SPHN|nr:hypothetical protein L288_20230 [Sphingobium quisquiliarum P25]
MNIVTFPSSATALLEVRDLHVHLADGTPIVSGISLSVAPGQILGLVGESGSGKSTIGSALLGHVRPGARIVNGSILVEGVDVLSLSGKALQQARGKLIAHVPQDPAATLNPMMRIGGHLHELLEVHEPTLSKAERGERIAAVLSDVGLSASNEFLHRFPHQLSGGQQQRILLALAFLLKPRLIVLDEPTTALDVSTQAQVIQTIASLCKMRQVAAVYVSHDLDIVRHLADTVTVLYAGQIVESASRDTLFAAPAHPYSRGLLAAAPDIFTRHQLAPIPGQAPAPADRPMGCSFGPRCASATPACAAAPPPAKDVAPLHRVACFHPSSGPLVRPEAQVRSGLSASPILLEVNDLSASYGDAPIFTGLRLALPSGRCSALVGESGSGKTTLARALAGLGQHVEGSMRFDGGPLPIDNWQRSMEQRRRIQYIFQNPYRALNPRRTIGQTLTAVIRHFFGLGPKDAERRAAAVLQRVALPSGHLHRYPRDLSGGERQRVAIARALACEPDVLICDEITSALDVSVQAAILDLLRSLQGDGLTVLFVTHDLAVVRAIADNVLVLRHGRIIEQGEVDDVLDAPKENYTRQLMASSRHDAA